MAKQKVVDKVEPAPLQYVVRPFRDFMLFSRELKKVVLLHYTTHEVFLCLVYNHYTNGKGCSTTGIMKMLYNGCSASLTRAIRYRLVTLKERGLVYSVKEGLYTYYYLSEKAKTILEEVNKVKRK